MSTKPSYEKDPDNTKPYSVDFTTRLAGYSPVANIASHQIVAPAGITVAASSNTTKVVTAALTGGTAGQSYDITFRATLDQGTPTAYSEDQTIRIVIREQ